MRKLSLFMKMTLLISPIRSRNGLLTLMPRFMLHDIVILHIIYCWRFWACEDGKPMGKQDCWQWIYFVGD